MDRTSEELDTEERSVGIVRDVETDFDFEFGGREARLILERRLLRKLDLRMSILVLIYILNYVRLVTTVRFYGSHPSHLHPQVDRNNVSFVLSCPLSGHF